jgi:hypothetical protein
MDDLGEIALERLQVFHFGDFPGPSHIRLRARTRIQHRFLLVGIELSPQLHRHGDDIGNTHVLIKRVKLGHLIELLGNH